MAPTLSFPFITDAIFPFNALRLLVTYRETYSSIEYPQYQFNFLVWIVDLNFTRPLIMDLSVILLSLSFTAVYASGVAALIVIVITILSIAKC